MKRVFIILVATALITGCYKSELTNTTHPDEGKVEVEVILPTTDPETGESSDPDATTPTSYTLILNGEEVAVGEDGTVELPDNLEPYEYTIYVYSDTDEMHIDHDIDETGEGTITSSKIVDAGMVESLTVDLYFGTQTITVLADEVIYSEIVLSQVTRTIKFNLQIAEGDPDRIASVSATLGGVAGQWECVEDIPIGDAVSIALTFTQGESLTKADVANDYLTSSIKVLGITGDEQDLVLKITYTDGTTQEVTSSLGTELEGSNDTKSTPILISLTLNIPIEGSLEGATIDNWTQVNGGEQTVN